MHAEDRRETNLINSSPRPKKYKSSRFICQPTLWIIQCSNLTKEGREKVVRKVAIEQQNGLSREVQNKSNPGQTLVPERYWRQSLIRDYWLLCHQGGHHLFCWDGLEKNKTIWKWRLENKQAFPIGMLSPAIPPSALTTRLFNGGNKAYEGKINMKGYFD